MYECLYARAFTGCEHSLNYREKCGMSLLLVDTLSVISRAYTVIWIIWHHKVELKKVDYSILA